MHFTKMHGLGNDYLYIYGEVPPDVRELSVRLSDRHTGAGSDGLIYISPSASADFAMRIFNADGSEAMMCGNGIRCVGKYVYDKGYTDKTELLIETLSGIKRLKLHLSKGRVSSVTVDMGTGKAGEDMEIGIGCAMNLQSGPAAGGCGSEGQGGEVGNLPEPGTGSDREGEVGISLDSGSSTRTTSVTLTPVSVGNPHAVIFVPDPDQTPIEKVGPLIEHHEAFPDGVNVEFVRTLSGRSLRMRVWERGSGVTMACGTGACASVFAAVKKGLFPAGESVTVQLDGGPLEITTHADGRITMRGPAEFIFEGDIDL